MVGPLLVHSLKMSPVVSEDGTTKDMSAGK